MSANIRLTPLFVLLKFLNKNLMFMAETSINRFKTSIYYEERTKRAGLQSFRDIAMDWLA
jgi:hypothetical protein